MSESQDLHVWLAACGPTSRDDVLHVDEAIADEDAVALMWEFAVAGRAELLPFTKVEGKDLGIVTNAFASRHRLDLSPTTAASEPDRSWKRTTMAGQ